MKRIGFFLLLATALAAGAQTPDSSSEKRAAGWVASLQLNDPAKETRLTAVIATHLTRVRDWNNEHPYTTVPAGIDPATGKPLSTMDRTIIAVSSMPRSAHDSLMTGLRQDLTEDQVEAILDKYTIGKAQSPAIVKEEFLYETAPFPECHAATVAETPRGLIAAFFGGTKERNPDVCIYVCRKDQGSDKWSAPMNVANGIQNDTLRYACWNPVLYQVPAGDLLLFYKVGPSPAKWKGWLIRSKDGGATWSKPQALPEGILGPIKNQPIRLANGALLCPTSTEGNGWHIHFEETTDGGQTWQISAPPADSFRAIQPTLLVYKNGSIQALSRSENRAILSTISKDNGRSWSPQQPIGLPNNNSGIDGTTLADGRQLLVYNHVLPPPGETKGERSPLNVALSPDGNTWYAALVLDDDHTGQYSYPTVIQSADGKVHIVYTWHRRKIKYVEIDPAKLRLEKIVNGVWPENVKK